MKEGAQSDLRHFEGWMDETIIDDLRELLAAINRALDEAAA